MGAGVDKFGCGRRGGHREGEGDEGDGKGVGVGVESLKER
jgi:hypothetical protein